MKTENIVFTLRPTQELQDNYLKFSYKTNKPARKVKNVLS